MCRRDAGAVGYFASDVLRSRSDIGAVTASHEEISIRTCVYDGCGDMVCMCKWGGSIEF